MPTGLDEGARRTLLRPLTNGGVSDADLFRAFLDREAYGDADDYLAAVAEVWSREEAYTIKDEMRKALVRLGADRRGLTVEPTAFLLTIPEPDFLTAVEAGVARVTDPYVQSSLPRRLSDICAQRGLPYRMESVGPFAHFVWTGDAVVNEQVHAPALAAIDDPRFVRGPRVEFASALAELRSGTPQARKQAVAEACNAVESAMKVLLDERTIARPTKENADDLYNALVAASAVPKEAREIVLAPSRFGNRKGRHGAGPVAHDVGSGEAEAVVSSAATALTFLASRLP